MIDKHALMDLRMQVASLSNSNSTSTKLGPKQTVMTKSSPQNTGSNKRKGKPERARV